MKRIISHHELRHNTTAILRSVMAGESFTVTNHGEEVAVISPAAASAPAGLRARKAVRSRFADIDSIVLDHPIQSTLDEFRGDR